MVNRENKSKISYVISFLLPAILTSLLVCIKLFRINTVQLSLKQIYFIVIGLVFYYLIIGLFIYVFLHIMKLIFSKIHTLKRIRVHILIDQLEYGLIPGGFASFYILDTFRHAFLVSRIIPLTLFWSLAALIVTITSFVCISYLFHLIIRSVIKKKAWLFSIILLLLMVIPYYLHASIIAPFCEQRTLLSTRSQGLASNDEFAQPTDDHVVVCGIDGATWKLLVPLMKMGHCPIMKRLSETGASGNLDTIIPTLSPVIWTSIATGMLPEKHGIHHFASFTFPIIGVIPAKLHWPEHTLTKQLIRMLEKTPFTHSQLYNSTSRTAPTFYEILSHYGETVGVVNWWCSWPLSPQLGFNISERYSYSVGEAILGETSHRLNEIYPSFLDGYYRSYIKKPKNLQLDELKHFMDVTETDLKKMEQNEKKPWFFSNWFWFRTVYQSDASLFKIGFELKKKYDPRLFSLYLQSIDVVEHHFWHYLEPDKFPSLNADDVQRFNTVIPAVYDYQDQLVGRLIEDTRQKTVIIASDHGMEPTHRLPKSGDHVIGKPQGIFIAAGPPIKQNEHVQNLSVIDVTPLILAVMGYPVSQDMDGRVPYSILTDAFLKKYPLSTIPTYRNIQNTQIVKHQSPTDQRLIDKLKGLGYLN